MHASVKNTLLATAGAAAALAGSSVVASADSITVKSGDTLYALAAAHHVTVDELVSANKIANANLIFTGQKIELPGSSATSAQSTASSAATKPAAKGTSYTVKSGDTLWAIANANGLTLSELLSANQGLQASSIIYVGDSINLTASATQASSAPVASSAAAQSAATSAANASLAAASSAAAQPQKVATSTASNNVVSADTTGNTYPYGQCTWYVKGDLSWVGNHWGNASAWPSSATAAGHTVNSTASVGAVAYFAPGVGGASAYGHVAVVDSVNSDGTITISEANYAGKLYNSRTISLSSVSGFIHQ